MSIRDLFSNGQPNILVIVTDQQRALQTWQNTDDQAALLAAQPGTARLMQNGMVFDNMFTAACMCTPSRGALLSGGYPITTGITTTFSGTQPEEPSDKVIGDFTSVLAGAATPYSCYWIGKWHLPGAPTDYGFLTWDGPPDAGTDLAIDSTLGGPLTQADVSSGTSTPPPPANGPPNNDLKFANDAAAFLAKPPTTQPWCLFVSFVNPHDIHVPRVGVVQGTEIMASSSPGAYDSGYSTAAETAMSMHLPSLTSDQPSTKPRVQANWTWQTSFGCSQQDYLNFYAELQAMVDFGIQKVLCAVTSDGTLSGNLPSDLLIVRMADHGEMGLSHDMYEKFTNAYDEVIRVPLIFANPQVWPTTQTTSSFASSIDLLPTFFDLLNPGASQPGYTGPTLPSIATGTSLVPILLDATATVQSVVHFTYDDDNGSEDPGIIRAVRNDAYLYAIYVSATQTQAADWELYDLSADPYQWNNVAGQADYATVQTALDTSLQAAMATYGTGVIKGASGTTTLQWPPTYVSGTSRGGPAGALSTAARQAKR